ncbi:glutamyl-tRNA reductase [Natribacillus halophilus]|uniref:Glutamyl-tRNA reductase n=1 Tax=Natribacillus halophilus TaxID=549003 RepID=A0A1G8LSX9_9BACI|nr:glutamyl-tRNA reductase [Natribacillus halophilus]SDI58597.1 glutamyl-tRNA reductase [Natribacillus halophilus]
MHILVASIDYKNAPVDMREQFAFDDEELPEAIGVLRDMKSILECTIVSTCNRTEVYAVVDQLHTGRHFIQKFISRWFDVPKEAFMHVLNVRENDEAITHLMRVSTGLESMVLGETQILGQVKASFRTAQKLGATGTVFNQLFRQVLTFAKRAHRETQINDKPASVSYAAVELGRQMFGDFTGKHVLILGAGKMSKLTAQHLNANGSERITVMNRTYERAEELAEQVGGHTRSLEEMEKSLLEADILISSTGSDQYVLKKEQVGEIVKKRKGRPLFMVDIAVPRDLDPDLGQLEDVFLYDIDDLEGIVAANMGERRAAAAQIETMIAKEMDDFKDWLHELGVVPVISALRTKALSIQAETMKSIERKMPDLDNRERKVLRKHTKSIVNQMLKEPITRAKEMAGEENREASLALFTEIFGLEDEVAEEKEREALKLLEQAQKEAEAENEEKKQDDPQVSVPLHGAYGHDLTV